MFAHTAVHSWRDEVEVTLDDGRVATLRPLRPGETAPLLAVFDGMSGLSRARRYLTGMPKLPPKMLHRLADVGGPGHVAWLALLDGEPVGVARYVAVDDCCVEVALEVVDRHHRRGLGGALLDTIVTVALANGYTSVTATVLASNRASVRLLSGLIGLRLHFDDGLLEGRGPLRLPYTPRVDRVAVLAVLEGQATWSGLNQDRALTLCSTQ
jgi:GNAT superfamily N-acetyltransferase